MPRLILKCPYLKGGSNHVNAGGYLRYIATRDGARSVTLHPNAPHVSPENQSSATRGSLPATHKQVSLIADLLRDVPDAHLLHEFGDYEASPTIGSASEFITRTLEENPRLTDSGERYVQYIAERPRVEKLGSHGLFGQGDAPIVLSQVQQEINSHTGNVWTPILSLRREDASRLGYDNAAAWQSLLRMRAVEIAGAMKIQPERFHWYAAFHDESHHPHCHMVCWSDDPTEGFLTENGIERIKSVIARDIFEQDLISVYREQTQRRNELRRQSSDMLQRLCGEIAAGSCDSPELESLLRELADALPNGGKQLYGYMPPRVKKIIDRVVDVLTTDKRAASCYDAWYTLRNEVYHTYTDNPPPKLPLSRQAEFKPIKNAVIQAAWSLREMQPDAPAPVLLPTEPADDGQPERNSNARRAFAYLTKARHIDAEVISHFVRAVTLYEDARYHNAVFVGLDADGQPRHAHKRSTLTFGEPFRANVEGSDARYGFGHIGKSDRLYVFEAPVDLLSYCSLHKEGWTDHSYLALNGVSDQALLQTLADHSHLRSPVLCLDNDAAGIAAAKRIAEKLKPMGYVASHRLSDCKDWNEALQVINKIAQL